MKTFDKSEERPIPELVLFQIVFIICEFIGLFAAAYGYTNTLSLKFMIWYDSKFADKDLG